MMNISPLAGKPAGPEQLINVPRLITAYYTGVPDYSGARATSGVWNLRPSRFGIRKHF